MVTLEEIEKLNDLHNLPKNIIVNNDIILDYRLTKSLNPSETDNRKRCRLYDFDVYLETYKTNLQRDYVWDHCQQNEFIFSILLEKKLEPVVVVQHDYDYDVCGNTVIQVIDGKQRLTTIKKFLNNEFPILINGVEYYYDDFDSKLKRFFESRVNCITATVYYSCPEIPITDDMKIYLFNFYNFSGTPQTEEHKNKLQSLIKK